MNRDSSPSLVCMCPPISYASVGGISQLLFQINSIYAIFMGYWMAGQVSTMTSSVIYKVKFIIGT